MLNFALQASVQLRNSGLSDFACGIVKAASRFYPLYFISTLEMKKPEEHYYLVFEAEKIGYKMLAVSCLDRQKRLCASKASETTARVPIYRKRPRIIDGRSVKLGMSIPTHKLCEQYYATCSQIDRHNSCRQNDLQFDERMFNRMIFTADKRHFRANANF